MRNLVTRSNNLYKGEWLEKQKCAVEILKWLRDHEMSCRDRVCIREQQPEAGRGVRGHLAQLLSWAEQRRNAESTGRKQGPPDYRAGAGFCRWRGDGETAPRSNVVRKDMGSPASSSLSGASVSDRTYSGPQTPSRPPAPCQASPAGPLQLLRHPHPKPFLSSHGINPV